MSANGRTLYWPGRVLSAADLKGSLNGHSEVVLAPRAVLTPLADEELRRAGVLVTRQEARAVPTGGPAWGYAQDRPHPLVRSAVTALGRDGLVLKELTPAGDGLPCRWAKALAECVAKGECAGGVVFCA